MVGKECLQVIMSADNNLVKHASHCAMKSKEVPSSGIVANLKQKRGNIRANRGGVCVGVGFFEA